jgi:hypothetical protein
MRGQYFECCGEPTRFSLSFYVTGITHSILGGSAWEPTPWRAAQWAAWGTPDGTRTIRAFTTED